MTFGTIDDVTDARSNERCREGQLGRERQARAKPPMPEPIHQQNKAANGDNNVAKMHGENQRGIVSRRNGRCKPAYNAGEWTYEKFAKKTIF